MANHVHYNVTFYQINDAAKAKLKELFSRVRTDNNYLWFADVFVEGDLTYEETEQYSWTTENIGPKWCYIEDYDVDDSQPYFNGESAWSPPTEGVIKLLEILEELDPKMIATLTYEDEMPNFVGGDVFNGSDLYEGIELDWNEIVERVIAESEILTEESWDADEGDWIDDEARETFYDEMWDVINDTVWDFCMEEVNYLKNMEVEENEEAVSS
jgi:hypothetical protein